MAKRKRRSFNKEFKAEAVRLCKVGDRSVGQVARDLDLTETALRAWVKQADVDAGKGPPEALTTVEREELSRLRRENKKLQMERDILKAAATPSSRRRASEIRFHRSEGGGLPGDRDVPSAFDFVEWLLCVEEAAIFAESKGGRPAHCRDRRGAQARSSGLWQPSRPSRTAGTRCEGRQEARGSG